MPSELSEKELFAQLGDQKIEPSSEAFGNPRARFRVFGSTGEPRSPFEKIKDAAQGS